MATIRKRGKKYQAIIRRKGHAPLSATFPKKILAEKWAREQENRIDEATYIDTRAARTVFMRDLVIRYLDEIVPGRKPTSHSSDTSRANRIDAYFDGYTLAELTPDSIVQYVRSRAKQVSGDAIRREIQVLSDIVSSAMIIWGYRLPSNPVIEARQIIRKLRLLPPKAKRTRRLQEGEYAALTSVRHQKYTAINSLIAFTVETGMRRGELSNMRRSHICFRDSTLLIPAHKTDHLHVQERIIPLSARAIEILKGLPARTDGRVWGLTPRSITQAFDRNCAQCKIEGLHFHDLRHECISRLFERGWDIAKVAAVTGHSDWESLKIYTQISPRLLAQELA